LTEDLGNIISGGFNTWKRNIQISIPFILNFVFTIIIVGALILALVLAIFAPVISLLRGPMGDVKQITSLVPQDLEKLPVIIAGLVVFIFLALLIQSFFTAGAIGMAKKAIETGTSNLKDMVEYGKNNFLNLFLANILIGLLALAGVVFLVPGALMISPGQFFAPEALPGLILIAIGFLVWILYGLGLSIILSMVGYSLVIEGLGPVEGIKNGFSFFMKNKLEVIIIWILILAITMVLAAISVFMGLNPILGIIWPIIHLLISLIIVAPLSTVWWTRLYISGTGKSIATF